MTLTTTKSMTSAQAGSVRTYTFRRNVAGRLQPVAFVYKGADGSAAYETEVSGHVACANADEAFGKVRAWLADRDACRGWS